MSCKQRGGLPINRIWLAFFRPDIDYSHCIEKETLDYTPWNNSDWNGRPPSGGCGFMKSGHDGKAIGDGGYQDLKKIIKNFTTANRKVEVFLSMGGWNFNCFPELYTINSIASYPSNGPNYFKIKGNCSLDPVWCGTCEPLGDITDPIEYSQLFTFFPDPCQSGRSPDLNSGGIDRKQNPKGCLQPGTKHDNLKLSLSQYSDGGYPEASGTNIVRYPFTGGAAKLENTPGNKLDTPTQSYTSFCDFAAALGADGVDIDYEEFWHADTYRSAVAAKNYDGGNQLSIAGPVDLQQTADKFSDIIQVFQDYITNKPLKLKLSTPGGAASCVSGDWWGGNLKGLNLKDNVKEKLKNFSDINIMTYDLSGRHTTPLECGFQDPDQPKNAGIPPTCDLPTQVSWYMNSYLKESEASGYPPSEY